MVDTASSSQLLRRVSRRRRFAAVAGLLAVSATAAHGLDALAAKPPVEVTDGRITIGQRTLWLPPGSGRWVYIDHGEIAVSGGLDGNDTTMDDRVVLARVDHGVFTFGLELWLLRKDIVRSGWDFGYCDNTANIYFNQRTRLPSQRDCVTVRGQVTTAFQQYLAGAPGALSWLQSQQIRLPDATAKIRFGRAYANTYGVIDVFIPADRFDSELATIAWAESMRTALKPLFEHHEDEGRIPPLP